MNKNLLILGAGQYGTVAKEIAEEMGISIEVFHGLLARAREWIKKT